VVVVALLATACNGASEEAGPTAPVTTPEPTGGGEVVAPDSFVDGLCTAMGDWVGVLQGGNEQLQQDLGGITSADQAIDLLVGYLDSTVEATEALISEVESLGAPDVEGGEEARQAFLDTFEGVREALADAADEVRGLDTSDPQALTEALTTLSSDLTAATGELVGPLARTSIPELEQAYEDTASCDVIKGLGE
jgi:hypothetical protein